MKNEIMKNDATNNTITTIEIAEMMEVSHKSILRKIDGSKDRRGYAEILTENHLVLSDYFITSTYKDASGKENKCYLVTKLGCDFLAIEDPIELKKVVVSKGLFTMEDLEDYKSLSQIIDFVYKKTIRCNIVQPTIIYNYPAVLIPLARRNDEDSRRVDMFQVVASGTELCKAFSELVNPFEQRQAFEEQLKAKSQGDDETMDMDEGFLSAMETGMPPISGLGFGIDRLMMIIYNQPSIRDVVLFPQMKDVK